MFYYKGNSRQNCYHLMFWDKWEMAPSRTSWLSSSSSDYLALTKASFENAARLALLQNPQIQTID